MASTNPAFYVWVAKDSDYEGEILLDVFDSEEAAREAYPKAWKEGQPHHPGVYIEKRPVWD